MADAARSGGRRRAVLVGGAVVAVVASLVVSVVAWRDHEAAEDQREAAEAAAARDRRAASDSTAQLARIEGWIDEAGRAEARDESDAAHISAALTDLGAYEARLDEAEEQLAALTVADGDQVSQITVLRSCGRTLDVVRSSLARGDTAAATRALGEGRDACLRADSLVDGATGAVHPFDFPDPAVLRVDRTYHAYGTNGPGGTIQVLSSSDLRDWTVRGSALVAVPGWAQPGFTWAPAVTEVWGGYVMYYAVRHRESGRQCLSRAVATDPVGPFVDESPGPLVCQVAVGGSIDASPFRADNGVLLLTWKSEGETAGGRSQIWVQPLSPDGLTATSHPVALLSTDRDWEGRVIEAPSMAQLGGRWVLLYSGNSWNTDRYGIGYAHCAGPLGPCSKPSDNLLLASDDRLKGPGGAEVFRTAGGRAMIAYAGWDAGDVGPPNPRRLHIAELAMAPDGRLRVG